MRKINFTAGEELRRERRGFGYIALGRGGIRCKMEVIIGNVVRLEVEDWRGAFNLPCRDGQPDFPFYLLFLLVFLNGKKI